MTKIEDMTRMREIVPQENIDFCASLREDEKVLIREIISRLVDKWSLWVLSELIEDGPLRFSRLLDRVEGISQKSLTATLRKLERDGLVTRTVTVQVPIRVDYEATPMGVDIIRHVDPLWTWAARNLAAFAEARENYDRMQDR